METKLELGKPVKSKASSKLHNSSNKLLWKLVDSSVFNSVIISLDSPVINSTYRSVCISIKDRIWKV